MDKTNHNKDLTKSARERLLDSAEELFAEKGYNGCSIREITAASNSNIAAVNYHFGGKENLYVEVFKRLMTKMRNVRLASIDKVMSQTNPKPTLNDLLHAFSTAFIEPLIDQSGRSLFMKLMIREMSDPHLPKKMFVEELVAPTLNALGKGLMQLCPGLDQQKAVLSIISIVGQLVHIIRLNEMFDLDEFVGDSAPRLPEMVDHIVEFSAAGIQAAAKRTD
jgi:AcrR family transcriptional regulator